ncbi:MAG: amidohydrolase [Spirochaetaceae bacterium]|jgi:amidohydrolase|nr:amidohydrolase [Spirochaetaceae bacterium]
MAAFFRYGKNMRDDDLRERLQSEFEWLHQHPELSGAEFETTRHIRAALEAAGVPVLDTGLATGLVAEIRGRGADTGGTTVALRADIDALPITEETGLPHRSRAEGCMHACGHDFHTSALLGAALLLAENRATLPGTVKLIFQPAEESSGGAAQVLATGALEDVREIYGLHVMPNLASGVIAIKEGATFAASAKFTVDLRGTGGHAAMPEQCKDPVLALAALIQAAQSIVSRRTSPFDAVVVSFTHIEAGRTWNVIPAAACAEGTIRALGTERCEQAARELERLCAGIASAYDVEIVPRVIPDTPATNNNSALCDFARETARATGCRVIEFTPIMGSEDFALYQQRIPGVFFCAGVQSPFPLHHPRFLADTAALPQCARLLALLAERALHRLQTERPGAGLGTPPAGLGTPPAGLGQ